MCGIAGIVNFNKSILEEKLRAMIETLSHRGPDYRRIQILQNAALAHARLSIIDLSEAASQPMVSNDGRYWISFNGEIYNYRDLKMELERLSIPFHTQSDTEVIINGFSKFGIEWIKKLNGVFGLAIWDTLEDKLFL